MQAIFDTRTAIVRDPDLAEAMAVFGDSAADLLAGRSPLQRLRDWRAASPRFDRAVWAHLAEAGWPAVLVPEENGGLGLDLAHAAAIMAEVGRHPLPEPVLAAAFHAPSVLAALPPGALRGDLLAGIAAGEVIAGVAFQETAHDDDRPHAPAATARRDGAEYVLGGAKTWVVPGRGADGWIVTATGPQGLAAFWVPADRLAVTDLARVDGSSMATLALDGARVPADHCLATGAAVADALAQGNDIARVLQAAELLGIAQQSFDLTLDYLATRVQFDQPVGANQALQHRMVDGLVQLQLARAALGTALAAPGPAGASRAKARCAQTALHITRMAVQFHGAFGYTDECDVGFYYKRALQLASWLGTAAAHRLRWLDHAPAAGAEDGAAPATAVARGDADWSAMPEPQFRAMIRAFLRDHYPQDRRFPPVRLHWPEIRDWYMTLSRQGWLAPAWPREHGGMGLPPDKMLAFIEEMEDYGVARTPDQGIINLGPILIQFGTPEQKAHYLPRILTGEHIWCQGYSEPNAGSDLASLRTEAVIDGDHFIVNGQKIWSTMAMDATHSFLLVRTNKAAKKQAGISFLLVDLSSRGVTVRPIRNIAGEEEFCEIFFDNVRVPVANLVGQIDQGWTIAKALLGWERLFVGSPKTSQYALGLLRKAAQGRGIAGDAGFRQRLAELELDVADLAALYAQYAELMKKGESIPPSVSVLKIWATETYGRIAAYLVEISGEAGAEVHPPGDRSGRVDALTALMNSAVTTIYGGTNEIQRNILAQQVLRMPRLKHN